MASATRWSNSARVMESMRGSWARLGVSSPVGSWYSSLFWSVLSDDRSIMADLRYLL